MVCISILNLEDRDENIYLFLRWDDPAAIRSAEARWETETNELRQLRSYPEFIRYPYRYPYPDCHPSFFLAEILDFLPFSGPRSEKMAHMLVRLFRRVVR